VYKELGKEAKACARTSALHLRLRLHLTLSISRYVSVAAATQHYKRQQHSHQPDMLFIRTLTNVTPTPSSHPDTHPS